MRELFFMLLYYGTIGYAILTVEDKILRIIFKK